MSLKKGKSAVLVLEDGMVFEGDACGAVGEATGELVFNTSLTGYQEILTDPSYAGQIVTMTYPQIGNYGVNGDDMQSRGTFLRGMVVHDMCDRPSNYRATQSLPEFLKAQGIVAIEGIDTRKLVRHVREHGAMKAIISTAEDGLDAIKQRLGAAPALAGHNFAAEVSAAEPYERAAEAARHRVIALDCGIKTGILDGLVAHGCDVTVMPWDTPAQTILDAAPDGVFLSNGPGDPEAVTAAYETARALIGKLPVFGICLGHQMLSIAAGAQIEKLKYGHHGGNQPVMNLLTGSVEITAQNHGFGQVFESIGPLVPELSGGVVEHPDSLLFWTEHRIAPVVESRELGHIQLTHVNLNDGTPEGMRFLDYPAFSVQYHPESAPGPHDSSYLFEAFARLMDGRGDYLDIEVRDARAVPVVLSGGAERGNTDAKGGR